MKTLGYLAELKLTPVNSVAVESSPEPRDSINTGRQVTGKETEEILALYGNGLNAEEVGRQIGRPGRTVLDVLRRHDIKLRRRTKLDEIDSEEVVELYESGLSPIEVGTRLGISSNSVNKILIQAGIETRKLAAPSEEMEIRLVKGYENGASRQALAEQH
ncbi:hypothetical protein [Leucobacter sp. GX0328]